MTLTFRHTHNKYCKYREISRQTKGHENKGSMHFSMCPLIRSKDKLLPLKAKPNQTWTVISVTVAFGFKSGKLTVWQNIHSVTPRKLGTHVTAHTWIHTACLWDWIKEKESLFAPSEIQAFTIKKPLNHPGPSVLTGILSAGIFLFSKWLPNDRFWKPPDVRRRSA